jgi:hypothetical protein
MSRARTIRVPARVADFLLQGQCACDLRAGKDTGEPADLVDVVRELIARPANADGSVSLPVTEDRLAVLAEYGDYLVVAASDDAGHGDMSALADVNAGRAMIRRVYAIRYPERQQ